MQKIIAIFLLYSILIQPYGRVQRKIATYLLTQYNKTLYDRTLGNNPWGIGMGVQSFFSNNTKFKPALELTGDFYHEDDKVLRLTPDGKSIKGISTVVNLFAGSSFHPTKNVYLSLLLGPSFINGKTLLGIKPSFGFYFSKNQRWTCKASYINIYNREGEDFGSIAISLGVKLY